MQQSHICYGTAVFHVLTWGHGKELLVCFHGFGESAQHFACLEETLGDDFSIVAIDLPYHGNTHWPFDRELSPAVLQFLLGQLLRQHEQTRCTLLGYSMGGRLALHLFQTMPAQVKGLVLLAPDGIRQNSWHWFATKTWLGHRIFRYNIYRPGFLFFLMNCLRKLRLLNESVYKFSYRQMNELEQRLQVYNVWTCLRQIWPSVSSIQKYAAAYPVSILLVFGKYDRIIPPVIGERFCRQVPQARLLVLEKGHQLLSSELGFLIQNHLLLTA